MELEELQQGLQNMQSSPQPEAPWLTMDNMMSNYGSWFDNDAGLGEMLLGQLRAHGVDTKAATEAMLRQLLQGIVDDLNILQQKLTGFTTMISQQMQNTQAVADSVQAAIDMSNPSPAATDILPPVMNDLPVAAVSDMGTMAPMPAEAPATEAAPAEPAPALAAEPASAEPEPAEQQESAATGTVSDARVKKVYTKNNITSMLRGKAKPVVSDANKKNVLPSMKLAANILAACQGGL